MTTRKDRLGRGLGALLGDYLGPESAPVGDVRKVPVSGIAPNPLQPRKAFSDNELDDLVGSIRENGLLQPIMVVKKPGGDTYDLLAGHLRLAACKKLGWKTIPAVVMDSTREPVASQSAIAAAVLKQ